MIERPVDPTRQYRILKLHNSPYIPPPEELLSPAYRNIFPPLENSTPIPPTGFSLSEDVDATPSLILTEYDLDLWVLRGCYEGLKSAKKVSKHTRNRPPVRGLVYSTPRGVRNGQLFSSRRAVFRGAPPRIVPSRPLTGLPPSNS